MMGWSVPRRMIKREAKALEESRRLARGGLYCAAFYWFGMVSLWSISSAVWKATEAAADSPAMMALWVAWLVACGLVNIAGIVGVCVAVAAVLKGGMHRTAILALLANMLLVILVVVNALLNGM